MESKGYFRVCSSGCILLLVYDHFDSIEFFLCIWPKNQCFFEQIETSFHDFLIVFVVAVVEGNLDEEIEADLCGLVIIGGF